MELAYSKMIDVGIFDLDDLLNNMIFEFIFETSRQTWFNVFRYR